LLLLGALVSLYFSLFRLPFTPVWMGYDHWGIILDAARMWGGERIYRDFLDQTPPGVEVMGLLFFSLFGLRNWIPSIEVILLGLANTWLIVLISRKVIRSGRFLALLPGFLFLTVAFLPTMSESHRWFSTAASLGALAVVMEERTLRRLGLAGVLSGIASFFTQTQGVFAVMGLAFFLFWDSHRVNSSRRELWVRISCLLTSFVVTVLATYAYFARKAGLAGMLDCLVRYPLVYYSADRVHNSLHVYMTEIPQFPPWSHLPLLGRFLFIHALLPLIYLVFLVWRWRKGANGEEGVRLMLVNIMGLFLFASIARSPSYLRLCTVSPPALITMTYWIRGGGKLQRISAGLLWFIVLGFATVHPMRVQRTPVSVLLLPRGPIAFSVQDSVPYQLLDWLSSQTRPGQAFFTAGQTGIFFPLALRPVDKTPGYDNTGGTRPEDVLAAVAALEENHVRFLEWPPGSYDPRFYRPEEDHLAPLREYVQRNYHLVKRFESPTGDEFEEIWERNP
jgi:hypothetical protein